jgi:hypothetical protein
MAWATACFFVLAAFAAAVVMVDKPVTVAVPVPEKVRQSKVVLLQLEGVLVRRNAPAVWNVFWDLAAADAETSVDNKHFAGYITSLPNSGARGSQPANFTLELPAAAVEALRRETAMHFTFVPAGKLPEGGVTITALRLE